MIKKKQNPFLKGGTVATLCFGLVLCALVAFGCNKLHDYLIDTDSSHSSCKFENPLTDLLWLKNKVDEITYIHTSIYQCTYGNGETGFLIDEGNTKPFYNCEGEILCIMGGFIGETCSHLNITNKTLIWKKSNLPCDFVNPLTDLSWLKKIVDDFIEYSNTVNNRHFQIYQCTYVEDNNVKIGFIVTPICVDCQYGTIMSYSCAGTKLCNNLGEKDCDLLYNITNKQLIWEINN